MLSLLAVVIGSFFIFSLIHYYGKNKKPCKRAFLSVLCGPLLLVVLNILSSVTGVLIPLSQLSIMISTALGIPGVSLLVIMTALM